MSTDNVWTCERHLSGASNEALSNSRSGCYFCTLEERDRLLAEGWPRSPEIPRLNRRLWKLGRARWEAEKRGSGTHGRTRQAHLRRRGSVASLIRQRGKRKQRPVQGRRHRRAVHPNSQAARKWHWHEERP